MPYTALHALQELGPLAVPVIDRLVMLDRKNKEYPMDPLLVAETLAKMGPRAIPRLIFHLRSSAPSVDNDAFHTSGIAFDALYDLGRQAVPALIEVLPDPQRSNDAVNLLAHLGPEAADAVPALIRLYREGTPDPEMAGPRNPAVIRRR